MVNTIMSRLRSFNTERLLEMLRETSAKETVNWSERKSYLVTDDSLVKNSERDEMVAFLLEVCERQDMSLSIDTFSLFVHLLDRFLSSYKVKSKYLECLAVACLYIACKVKEEDENIAVTREFLDECECKCSVSDLLRMEQMVLAKFEWNVNDTTAIDFVYIYHALLVNELNRAMSKCVLKEGDSNKRGDEIQPVPEVLDILHRIEYRLKKCLCISELADHYRPQLMAYSLLSLEMDRVLPGLQDESSRNALLNTLELLKSMGKLRYESIDKCKYEIAANVSELDEDEYNLWSTLSRLRDYPRTYGMSPLLYNIAAGGLDVIEEVDENEDTDRTPMITNDSSSEFCGSTSSSSSSLALPVHPITYADVLLGRQLELKIRRRENLMSYGFDDHTRLDIL